MSRPVFPKHEGDLTPELMTSVLAEDRPGLVVQDLTVVEAIRAMSGQASTADRVILDLNYAPGTASANLPQRVILKTMLDVPHAPGVMYETEVRFYREIRPQVPFEAPVHDGGAQHLDPALGSRRGRRRSRPLDVAWEFRTRTRRSPRPHDLACSRKLPRCAADGRMDVLTRIREPPNQPHRRPGPAE